MVTLRRIETEGFQRTSALRRSRRAILWIEAQIRIPFLASTVDATQIANAQRTVNNGGRRALVVYDPLIQSS